MRIVNTKLIYDAVYTSARECVCKVDEKVLETLRCAARCEQETAAFALNTIIQSDETACLKQMPACQDTGMAVVFVDIGQDVFLEGDLLEDAVNDAVRDAYRDGCFRKSVLSPLSRINTKDNTPAVLHTTITKGDKIKVSFLAKGFGSENMSKLFMLTPADGIDGIKRCVRETVISASGNPCPPIVLGIGIGGTMEKCAIMAKRALLAEQGERNNDALLASLENELLNIVNETGVGALGFGGKTTALDVHILAYPTHLASLPLAINVQCHSVRHKTVMI